MDKEKIEKAVRDILEAIGENPRREDLLYTPKRVAEMYKEIFSGVRQHPEEELEVVLDQEHHEMILLRSQDKAGIRREFLKDRYIKQCNR